MWTNIIQDMAQPEKADKINKWFEKNESKIKIANDLQYLMDHINMLEDRFDILEDKIKKQGEKQNG